MTVPSSYFLLSVKRGFRPSSRTCDDHRPWEWGGEVWGGVGPATQTHCNCRQATAGTFKNSFHFPVETSDSKNSHVRTSVYTAKLKGNQVSRISPNRNKKQGFRGRGWGGRLKGEGGEGGRKWSAYITGMQRDGSVL